MSRELDELIAEKILGWRAAANNIWETSDGEWTEYHTVGAEDNIFWAEGVNVFSPSTEIAHAWEVVEKLTTKPYSGSLALIQDPDMGGIWLCSFDPEAARDLFEGLYPAETAPLAICHAALKLIGIAHEQPQ